jgi:hypothetical protein
MKDKDLNLEDVKTLTHWVDHHTTISTYASIPPKKSLDFSRTSLFIMNQEREI